VVSLSPRNTELIFAVGGGDQIVAVTDFCDFPAEARERPSVGGFAASSLNLEMIVSLKPDLVVSAGKIHRQVIDQLERMSIPVVALESETFDSLYDDVRLLGRLSGHEHEATQLIDAMRDRVARVADLVRDIESDERVSVLYQVIDEPLTIAGPASFIGEMIRTCGGVNIIPDGSMRYVQISSEFVLSSDADVILAPSIHAPGKASEQFVVKEEWSNLPAVKNGRVHLIDGNLVSRFGPRSVDALEIMATALYPNQFKERPQPSQLHSVKVNSR
jgi:iron complex transport system substrate-binding protein